MVEYFTVGPLIYAIAAPFPVRTMECDEQFRIGNGKNGLNQTSAPIQNKRRITVVIFQVDELPVISEPLLFQYEGVMLYAKTDGSLRSYTSYCSADHPVYMQSRYKNNHIRLDYWRGSGLWTNPNFRIWNFLHLESLLLEEGGLILHCCYIQYRGNAILFSAPSGTGKTTQGTLWREKYGAEIVNGDRCLLLKKSGQWYACGYPLHGSASECENRDYLLRAVVLVRQDETDIVDQLSPMQSAEYLYSECTVNSWDKEQVSTALDLVMDLVRSVPVYQLRCTLKEDAAIVLHRQLFGEA